MTRFNPTLKVERLRIERLGHTAYDEEFHDGVNIIRGDNSSGKSTILNFLYYALGGDVSDWSPVALLCTRVVVQVSLNDKIATLSREISDKSGQPMDIFSGSLDEALQAPVQNWARHPYRRSESRESFSQLLFRLLGIPEASNEASGNVTIHQILRLMYADQLSPVGTLFKFEQFDPPLLRDAVGRLVFGAYENELYANELRIREMNREHQTVSGELSAISNLLGHSGDILTASWIVAERQKVEQEKKKNDADMEAAEHQLYEEDADKIISLESQQSVYAEVQTIQSDINKFAQLIDSTKFEIADSQKFIADLEAKLIALQDSSATSDAFGKISFQYCPACYSPVEATHPAHACHLCKNPFDGERARSRIVSLINDTARQLKQSRSLQTARTSDLAKAEAAMESLKQRWNSTSSRLALLTRTPSSAAREALRDLQRKAGYLDRQLEDLNSKERLSTALEKLISRKAELNSHITLLAARNESLKASLNRRLHVAYTEVENQILGLLHGDLPREEAFINARTVQFDFTSNKLSVDNQSYFSASSRVILRNSFFVGLLAAANKDPSFRHLRLCLLDSIEDKGMQPDRSHNFQRMIVGVSQAALSKHQVIFATSMIAPELDITSLTVGSYYTLKNHTLNIQTSH